ncbi:MAG: hypothetical protein E6G95_12790 [Alphaproteobacteria bacterium]|nr:MAG: hypothetical protein E6G95_12790 [Alphaproteobacteria bacterium]
MMVLFRALGWALLALAVGAIVYDCLSWWSDGAFRLLALGDLWSRLDLASLNALQRDVSGAVWTQLLLPVLRLPALAAFMIAGVIFLWLGRRIGSRAEPSFLGGARPRRRRSRGLS